MKCLACGIRVQRMASLSSQNNSWEDQKETKLTMTCKLRLHRRFIEIVGFWVGRAACEKIGHMCIYIYIYEPPGA